MPAIKVSRITPQQVKAYPVTTENVASIVELLTRGMVAGKFNGEAIPAMIDGYGPGWRVAVRPTDGQPDLFAYTGYWIVEYDDLELSVYDGPSMARLFHYDAEMKWDAAEVAPHAVVVDSTVKVSFPEPTSLNGPWEYKLKITDITNSASQVLDVVPEVIVVSPGGVVLGSLASVTLGDLALGHDYSVTVECKSQSYDSSALSVPVTFTVPKSVAPSE